MRRGRAAPGLADIRPLGTFPDFVQAMAAGQILIRNLW
jgi:hypothetical protein